MLLVHEIGKIIERENDNGKYKEKKKGESDFDPHGERKMRVV